MALHLYHDSSATNLVESGDEDYEKTGVTSGNQAVVEKQLYVGSDDTNLTYENISLDALGDEDGASSSGDINVEYAHDNSGSAGSYSESISLSNGDFDPAVPIWRKITAPSVTSAFKRTDIQHELTFDEYVK